MEGVLGAFQKEASEIGGNLLVVVIPSYLALGGNNTFQEVGISPSEYLYAEDALLEILKN